VKQYYCDIDIAHLIVYNDELAQNLTQNPAEVIPLVCGKYSMIWRRLIRPV
jgi:DNA replication licensing factor MCM5